jgi:hypothetical protein
MSEDDFTKSPRFQLILRDAIAYRVLRRMAKDWQLLKDAACAKTAEIADSQTR